ncbi:MAG: SCO1664 family protein [Anaerolineales bacterium]|nr:SCO1664 family protein [Anaerolineales bacterium]
MPNPDEAVLHALEKGKLTLVGEFLWGSNYTFSVQIEHEDLSFQGVYKPTRGERPLWDFPRASLARREVAAYLVSEALNWRLVPPTVYRQQAPIGPGSLQLFVEHDPEYHYFNFKEADRQRLRPVALFDLLINNADRKGSHVLLDPNDHLWLIDHGLCFHREDKLRTVIWDFAGEAIPETLCVSLTHITETLKPGSDLFIELRRYINGGEINALAERARRLIQTGTYPDPNLNRRPYPWPPV